MNKPIVTLEGVTYFIDKRLGELRQVDDPHNVISLEDYYDYLWETKEDDR